MEKDLKERFSIILSSESRGIGWKNGSDFDCGLCMLSRNQRKERLEKIRKMQKFLFCCLDEIDEEIFLVSHMGFKWNDWSPWFTDFLNPKRLGKNIFYRDILNEANRKNIKLITEHFINYKENKVLAEKFFRGNTEYIAEVCFCVPGLDFAIMPSHSIEFVLYSSGKGRYYKAFVNRLLGCSTELELMW
ncbi:MAG: hypothetical protein LIO44_03145 [Eubacterium sp.]|nr:hypothetical protein [Eubacterium sp.]